MMTFPQKRGEFTLLRKIGEGGMAEVFLAEREGDEDFKTLVALKRLHGGFALDQYFIRQLVQEAKLLGQLQHTNIVRVNDLRRIDDEYYIAMEYIDGIDVAQAIQVHRDNDLRFPLSIFFHIALSLCEALDFAHSATDMDGKPIRLIHRDIKPSNVLISNRGIVKLTDFGIARVGDTSNTGSVVKGTANYMSPEQASGEQNLTPASDIFSLGAVFWEMLTLEKLVEGSNYLTVINSIKDLNVGLKDITKKGIEPGLRMILLRMLARKRELRYQSMGLVLKDLRFVAEQMKVDLSPSHLREYMAKITQLARDAAGKLEAGTNLATAAAGEDGADSAAGAADPSDLPDNAATQPAETVPEAAEAPQEAAFAESVAALKALVQKDIDAAVAKKSAAPLAATSGGKYATGNAPTAPPQPPLPRKPAPEVTASTVDDDLAAPPSATGLHALAELARASETDKATTTPGAEIPEAPPKTQAKQSRKQKKKARKAGAPVIKAAAVAAGAGAAAAARKAAAAPVPPAGVPTPPMKPAPVAAPPPKAPAPPPPVAKAPTPPPAPAPEPVMEMLDGGVDGYDDGYDDDEWDEGGGGFMLYAAIAAVILLLFAVVWLMLSGDTDPGGDVVAGAGTDPIGAASSEAAGTGDTDAGAADADADAGDAGDAVADAGSGQDSAGSSAAGSAATADSEPATASRSTAGSSRETASRGSAASSSSPSSSRDRSSASSSSSRPTSSTTASSSPSRSSSSRDRASSSSRDTSTSSSRDTSSTSSTSRDRATASSRDTSTSSSRDTSSSASRDRATASSDDTASTPRYRGSSNDATSSTSSSSTASASTSDSSDDWATSSSDTRSPYDDTPDAGTTEPEDDGPVAAVDAPDAAQVLDDYSDMARRGRLGDDEIARLQGITPGAASYEPSRAVLLAQYEATGDQSGHCDVAGEVLAQPGNYADPQWNLEMSKCHLRKGRYEDALASSRVAELHAQDIPARSRTDRQLKIWEIQAKSYKGLYQRTENLDYLSDAIAVWKRYRHMANNTYRPREATRADEAIVALQDLSEGSL